VGREDLLQFFMEFKFMKLMEIFRVRISALGRLAKALTTKFLDEILQGQADELISLLQGSLKKGGAEAEWSSRVLALVWMTGGPHDAYNQLASFFSRSIKDVDIEVRPALLIAYSVIAFIEDLDDEDIWSILKEIMALLAAETDGSLMSSALSAFALLYSKLSSETEDDVLTE
jgi:hypothetical protein